MAVRLSLIHISLLHRPDLFNAYVSLDGALWWNNQRVVAEAKLILAKERFKGKALFIALANRMEKGMDTLAVQKDTTEGTEPVSYTHLDVYKRQEQEGGVKY